MNKIHFITPGKLVIGALLLFAFLTGCEELDFPNPNAPVADVVPDQAFVTGAEAGMRDDLPVYLRCTGSIGREVYYFEPADPRYTGNLLRGTVDPGGFLVTRPWSGRYAVVANCNELLARAGEDANGAGLKGFAKTIRAYQLMMNINYMYTNGIKLDQSDDFSVEIVTSPATSDAAVAAILDEAADDLAGATFAFTLTSGFEGFDTPEGFLTFNRALRARVAVYLEEWQDALDALDGSFIDETALNSVGVYHIYGTALSDQTNGIFELPSASFVKLMGHPTFETEAEAGDTRFSEKVVIRDLDKDGSPDVTVFDGLETSLGVTITEGSTDPLPIIRNEELLLLRAEANIRLGNFGDAETDINLVRARAGLDPVTLTDEASGIDQILYERRYSLFMEGHRWIDMRRYDRLDQLPIDRSGDPDVPDDVVLDAMPIPETEVAEG